MILNGLTTTDFSLSKGDRFFKIFLDKNRREISLQSFFFSRFLQIYFHKKNILFEYI